MQVLSKAPQPFSVKQRYTGWLVIFSILAIRAQPCGLLLTLFAALLILEWCHLTSGVPEHFSGVRWTSSPALGLSLSITLAHTSPWNDCLLGDERLHITNASWSYDGRIITTIGRLWDQSVYHHAYEAQYLKGISSLGNHWFTTFAASLPDDLQWHLIALVTWTAFACTESTTTNQGFD